MARCRLGSRDSAGHRPIRAVWLGTADYVETLSLQRRLVRLVSEGSAPETMLFLQHDHVFTLGRRGKHADVLAGPEELHALGVQVHEVDRGGEVTYHGPGQLVGYPIMDLRPIGGPLEFVCVLQRTVVSTLSAYGIDSSCEDRPTGIWVGDAKIGAIGLHVSRGVSSHGFAINVAPDLAYFRHIVPCGVPGADVTSMAREGVEATVREMASKMADALGCALGRSVDWTSRSVLSTPAGDRD